MTLIDILPQLIYITLIVVGITFLPTTKGEKEIENAYTSFFAVILTQALFYWGGFYSQIQIPQLVMLVFVIIAITISVTKHNKEQTKTGLTLSKVIGTIIQLVILYWGGFFDPLIKIICLQ